MRNCVASTVMQALYWTVLLRGSKAKVFDLRVPIRSDPHLRLYALGHD